LDPSVYDSSWINSIHIEYEPMATAIKTEPTKPIVEKVKKEPVPVAKRLADQMKRAAVNGKITKDELETLNKLTTALQAFISYPPTHCIACRTQGLPTWGFGFWRT